MVGKPAYCLFISNVLTPLFAFTFIGFCIVFFTSYVFFAPNSPPVVYTAVGLENTFNISIFTCLILSLGHSNFLLKSINAGCVCIDVIFLGSLDNGSKSVCVKIGGLKAPRSIIL